MAYDSAFARVYDKFTRNTDVAKRAAYLHSLLLRFGVADGILLDLACGTGAISEAFLKFGYEVIAADASYDMLAEAGNRLAAFGSRALILQQDMRELDLYGTVRACVCSLDSVNHLTEPGDVQLAFDRISLFTEPGGVFLFDVNTVYKHKEILGNNTFVYEDDNDFLVWQNIYDPVNHTVEMLIDVFTETKNGKYTRASDEITERAYETEMLKAMLEKAGFTKVYVFGDLSDRPPAEKEERVYFAALK